MDDNAAAAARVRGVFEEVVVGGFRAEAVEGACDEQIDAWAAAQACGRSPQRCGRFCGSWASRAGRGCRARPFGVTMVTAVVKEHAGGA